MNIEKGKRETVRGILMIVVMCGAIFGSTLEAKESVWDFEDVSIGKLPSGWRVDATNAHGELATWEVIPDTSAPSPKQVLALTTIRSKDGSTFNLCRTDTPSLLDGEIAVRFKANDGKIDQGGGVMWRVQDSDNYYIARFNPLEDNFRLYSVKDGVRKLLSDANVSLPAGEWHTMKVLFEGDHYIAYLNGKEYLEGRDTTFTRGGGVGLWTKADAATSFDDFSVKMR